MLGHLVLEHLLLLLVRLVGHHVLLLEHLLLLRLRRKLLLEGQLSSSIPRMRRHTQRRSIVGWMLQNEISVGDALSRLSPSCVLLLLVESKKPT